MKMTQEALESLIADQIKGSLATFGTEVTKAVEEQVEAVVKSTLKDKINIKDFLTDDVQQKGADPKGGFVNFSEFAIAVKNAEVSQGRKIDKRLEDIIQKTSSATSVQERDGEYGGYLIPEEFRNTLLELAINQSNIMKMALAIPMATNVINIPYVAAMDRSAGLAYGGVEFKWLDEEGTKTESRPKFGKVQLRLKKLAGLVYASDEILEDSPISLEPLLTRMFQEALTWTLDNTFINGTGAGRPQGVLNAPCLVSVAKEDGQDADTLLYENITKMYSRMWQKGNAIWMANDDTFPQLSVMSIAVGTGGAPVWLPAGGASGKPYDTLMGKPIYWTEHCQKIGDKGDILFCDWSQYLIGQKAGAGAGMKFASSIHLKFDSDQTAFRFVFRVDGQPWWSSPLTPRYSSATLSPFVALDARA